THIPPTTPTPYPLSLHDALPISTPTERRLESTASLLRELVAHLTQQRAQLREEWAQLITEAKLLTAMTKEEIFAEATSVYDNYEIGRSTRLNSSHLGISYAVFCL